ncbi:hypothetical protein CH330_00830 [candidate division WOR-3 bacterium JGI_Cruoil_03_51_56]|uniref:FlgD/Vpr Ig-like domain-containing protein n=1 Tax=candidate division WOR-3 bacterium JGI_Cruoil_03_51_56 TaxID=1973747 RepID=A0A235BXU0_UNCW3|nr:MAG: hypothetical protein CH330_00830 [candidate division WOR-3 bacterium JGI_Cruoil_03_51_56]
MKNRTSGPLPILLAVCLIVAAGFGQFVEDSIGVGGAWVYSLVYSSETELVHGASNNGIFFTISCERNECISAFRLDRPYHLAYDSIDNKVYCTFSVGHGGEESLAVVDGWGHRLKAMPLEWATIPLWDPVSNRVYVSCGDRNRVAVIDCVTDSVIDYIRVGRWPSGMDLNTRHHKLYVRNWDGESVSIIDLETNEVIRTIRLDEVPEAGWYSSVVDKYYCHDSGEVVAIDGDGDSIVGRIPVLGCVVSAVGNNASNLVMFGVDVPGLDSVFVVDAVSDSVVSVLAVGRGPSSLAWSQATNLVYCANATSGNVSVIAGDGSRVVKTLRVGDYPSVVLTVPEFQRVYVGHYNSWYVYVIRDTATGIREQWHALLPLVSRLKAYPNPFRHKVTVEYSGAAERNAGVSVYSQDGSLVKKLKPGSTHQGKQRFVWDGTDAKGRKLAAGVYFYALDTGNKRLSRKVVLTGK